jgi:hypothetical protein
VGDHGVGSHTRTHTSVSIDAVPVNTVFGTADSVVSTSVHVVPSHSPNPTPTGGSTALGSSFVTVSVKTPGSVWNTWIFDWPLFSVPSKVSVTLVVVAVLDVVVVVDVVLLGLLIVSLHEATKKARTNATRHARTTCRIIPYSRRSDEAA